MRNFSILFVLVISALLITSGSVSAQSPLPGHLLPGDDKVGPAAFDQEQPSIVAGGNQYLAVWTDYRSGGEPNITVDDGSGDIFATRLDKNGNLIDIVPILISMDAADQSQPDVAWNGTNWLVVWLSQTPTEFFWSMEILAVRVSPQGQVLDSEPISVYKHPSSSSADAVVASDGSNWVVVFRGTSAGENDLLGVRISAAGAVLDPGGVLLVPGDFSVFFSIDIAFAVDEYLLTYIHHGSVYGLRLDQNLGPIDSNPFKINVNTSGGDSSRVASNGSDFFVLWQYYSSSTQYGEALGARVAYDGTVLDPNGIQISGLTYLGTDVPRIAWDGQNWVATFRETHFSTPHELQASRITTSGQVLDLGGVSIEPILGEFYNEPEITSGVNGGIQVVWTDDRSGGIAPNDISTFFVSSDLTPGAVSVISFGSPTQMQADVSANGDGYMVIFRSMIAGENRIMAHPLDAAGNALLDEPVLLDSGPYLSSPAVAWDGVRHFVVWTNLDPSNLDNSVVYGQRIGADGTLIDLIPFTIMEGFSPDVAGTSTELFLVVAIQQTISVEFREPFGVRIQGSDGTILDPSPIDLGSSFAGAPAVTGMGNRWLMAYQRNFSHDDPNAEVRASFVGLDGSTSGFTIGTGLNPYFYAPAAASDGTDALVVWEDSGDDDISGVRILADGTVLPVPTVNSAPESQNEPALTWDGGQYVSLYEDLREITFFIDERPDIYATRVDGSGNVIDPNGFPVYRGELPNQDPAVAGMNNVSALLGSVFQGEAPFAAYRIAVRLLDETSPELSVSLRPNNPPIEIGPEGGQYSYRLAVKNNAEVQRTFDLWMTVGKPAHEKVLGPLSLTLDPGEGVVRLFQQDVPGTIPAGTYTHTVHVGTYPDGAESSDNFDWTKLP